MRSSVCCSPQEALSATALSCGSGDADEATTADGVSGAQGHGTALSEHHRGGGGGGGPREQCLAPITEHESESAAELEPDPVELKRQQRSRSRSPTGTQSSAAASRGTDTQLRGGPPLWLVQLHSDRSWSLQGFAHGFQGLISDCWDQGAAAATKHAEIACRICDVVMLRVYPGATGAFVSCRCWRAHQAPHDEDIDVSVHVIPSLTGGLPTTKVTILPEGALDEIYQTPYLFAPLEAEVSV